jgi:hypothetical protein
MSGSRHGTSQWHLDKKAEEKQKIQKEQKGQK